MTGAGYAIIQYQEREKAKQERLDATKNMLSLFEGRAANVDDPFDNTDVVMERPIAMAELNNIKYTNKEKKFFCVHGPKGCGKSVLVKQFVREFGKLQ